MSDIDQMRTDRNRKMQAARRKRIALAQLRGQPVAPIDARELRKHVKQLMNLHWGTPAILAAARVDGTPTGLLLIANGTSLRADRKFEPIIRLPLTLRVPERVPDHLLVPSLGSARRIRALMALGWRHEDISPMLGGRSSTHLSAWRHKTINAHDWRLVDAVYDALSGTTGPSGRSRKRATDQGYIPPLAWDDIDDPDETPKGLRMDTKADIDPVVVDRILAGRVVPATRAEREEVVRRWAMDGRSLSELERITGWQPRRYMERPGKDVA